MCHAMAMHAGPTLCNNFNASHEMLGKMLALFVGALTLFSPLARADEAVATGGDLAQGVHARLHNASM